jgi:Cu(I)/Ag(I) efflux system membrane fusion protein
MHPQIRQPESGDCPICGMDLIPLMADDSAEDGPRELSMSESSKALAEIVTTRVVRASPEVNVRMVGKLDFDETRLKTLSARFPARIERLFVNYTGIKVGTGDHLAEIYSPELLIAQRELLTAVQYDPDGITVQVAREKLRLWDLLPDQIDGILESGLALDHFELRAPIGGIVVQKNVKEGDYVKTGDPLFRIADLSMLWLPLEAFESDLQWILYGQEVDFEVESFPGEHFEGRVVFIDPVLNDRTRTVGVRVEVPNPDGRLKPGMFARATVYSRVASDGRVMVPELAGKWISPMHPEIVKDGPGQCDVCGMDLVPVESLGYKTEIDLEPPLLVPASAVLRTGRRAVVYVSIPSRDKPSFVGREITLGPRAGEMFLVVDGLEEGDEVVTNGAFKIDSALQIQAKSSMMNPEGGGSVPGHNHGASTSAGDGRQGHDTAKAPQLDTATARAIMPGYLALQAALANDDLPAAKDALRAVMEITGHSGPIPDLVHRMLSYDGLEKLRLPDFTLLSNALIAAVESEPSSFSGDLFVMHCPMADGNKRADWLHDDETVRNPYFGAMMLTCGEIKNAITAAKSEAETGHGN